MLVERHIEGPGKFIVTLDSETQAEIAAEWRGVLDEGQEYPMLDLLVRKLTRAQFPEAEVVESDESA